MSYTDSNRDTLLILHVAKSAGLDTDMLLDRVGIDPALLRDPETRIASIKNSLLLDAVVKLSGDPSFAVTAANMISEYPASLYYSLLLNCDTLLEAIQLAARYYRLHSEAAKLSVLEEDDLIYVDFDRVSFPGVEPRHYVEFNYSHWRRSVQLSVGEDCNPRALHFSASAPTRIDVHEEYFHCPVLFDQPLNRFIWDRETMMRPIKSHNPPMKVMLERYANIQLNNLAVKDEFVEAVKRVIANKLYQEAHSLQAVAEELSIAPRTLQYRLNKRNKLFKTLVDEVRHELAISLLADSSVTIRETALALGFSEIKSFYRAFRRWTGTTPADYRRSLNKDDCGV